MFKNKTIIFSFHWFQAGLLPSQEPPLSMYVLLRHTTNIFIYIKSPVRPRRKLVTKTISRVRTVRVETTYDDRYTRFSFCFVNVPAHTLIFIWLYRVRGYNTHTHIRRALTVAAKWRICLQKGSVNLSFASNVRILIYTSYSARTYVYIYIFFFRLFFIYLFFIFV